MRDEPSIDTNSKIQQMQWEAERFLIQIASQV